MKPEKKPLDISDDAKAIVKLLNSDSNDLNAVKSASGLSNKKWDKTIKELTKNKIVSVSKTEEGLTINFIK